MMGINLLIKRLMDIIGASLVLLVASPIMLVTAIAVRMNSRGPVLFIQSRAGKMGKPFNIYKFRTMQVNSVKGNKGVKINDPRITSIGHFLRKWSIDELPQLFNVIKGDMSLVGPRPLLPEYVERYSDRHRQRLNMKPGITGLQQVEAR